MDRPKGVHLFVLYNRLVHMQTLAVDVHPFVVDVSKVCDFAVQWVQHDAVGAASVTVYGALSHDSSDLEPDVMNPVWFALPEAIPSQPAAAQGTYIYPYHDNVLARIMVVVDVSDELQKFSLFVRGQGRS